MINYITFKSNCQGEVRQIFMKGSKLRLGIYKKSRTQPVNFVSYFAPRATLDKLLFYYIVASPSEAQRAKFGGPKGH